MNALTAPPVATTGKTSPEDIAPIVASTTQTRIDDFLRKQLRAARSDAGSGIVENAARLVNLGFTQCANTRYSEFLVAFRNSTDLDTKYREKYPSSIFVNWRAFHLLLQAMDLRVDLPQYYRGAIPSEQIPWMEIFELDEEDHPTGLDFLCMVQLENHERRDMFAEIFGYRSELSDFRINYQIREKAQAFKKEAHESFFVVAPPNAFSTKLDWLARLKRLMTDIEIAMRPVPPDPLVVRFCRGGVLVVAAWGDEAEALNNAVSELGI